MKILQLGADLMLSCRKDSGAITLQRVVLTLLEGVSLGSLGFVPDGAATGYLGFVTLLLYFVTLVLLPGRQRAWGQSPSLG